MFKTILKPFASLRLTVALLAMSMIVVFAGTWAQIDLGIWQVQRKYFHSFFCIIDFNIFPLRSRRLTCPPTRAPVVAITEFLYINVLSRIRLPMLGGYSLIVLLLVNLLAAHTVRFKLNARRTGIILLHAGLILLICGEVITSSFAVESQMAIQEGETVNFASDIRSCELAVIDPSAADHDTVVAIPQKMLATHRYIADAHLPFDIHVDKFFPNTGVLGPFQAESRKDEGAGDRGCRALVSCRSRFHSTAAREAVFRSMPSAYVTLTQDGKSLGTYLVSVMQVEAPMQSIDTPQKVVVDGKTYFIQLRFRRHYEPFQVTLLKFSFDRFTGTNTPRNYSSRVRIVDSDDQRGPRSADLDESPASLSR